MKLGSLHHYVGLLICISLAASLSAQKWAHDTRFDPTLTITEERLDGIAVKSQGDQFFLYTQSYGGFTLIDGTARKPLVRIDPSGRYDPGFAGDIGDQDSISDVAPLPEGGCWVLLRPPLPGISPSPNGGLVIVEVPAGPVPVLPFQLIKLKPDGSRDGSVPEILFLNYVRISGLSDGGVMVEGDFEEFLGHSRHQLARITPQGQIDPNFLPRFEGRSNSGETVVNPDGSVYVSTQRAVGTTPARTTIRLQPNGAIDPDFTASNLVESLRGLVTTPQGFAMHSGDVVYHFSATGEVIFQQRLFPLGNPHFPASPPLGSIQRLISKHDGQIIVITNNFLSQTEERTVRYSSAVTLSAEGAIRSDWQEQFEHTTDIHHHATNTSGNSLVLLSPLYSGPAFRWFHPNTTTPAIKPRLALQRNDQFETLDLVPSTETPGDVLRLWEDEHGRILVAGNFTSIDAQPRSGVARFLTDGQLDRSFAPPPVSILLPLADGSAMVRHWETKYSVEEGIFLATPHTRKLRADGTFDPTFTLAEPHQSDATTWLLGDENGNLLVSSYTSLIGANFHSSLVWLTPAGAEIKRLSPDFEQPNNFAQIAAIIPIGITPVAHPSYQNPIQSAILRHDGKILARGDFTKVAGQNRSTLVLITPEGEVDPSYNPELGRNSYPFLLADGGAIFGDYNPSLSPSQRMRKLLPSGALDRSFQPPYADGIFKELRNGRLFGVSTLRDAAGWPDPSFPEIDTASNGYFQSALIDSTGYLWLSTTGTYTSKQYKRPQLMRFSSVAVPGIAGSSKSASTTAGEYASFYFKSGSTESHTIKWFHNDVEIAGQTTSRLVFDRTKTSDAGTYHAEISFGDKTFATDPQTLTVKANTTRLVNYSARSFVTADNPQIMGFVPTIDDARPFLIRALGWGIASVHPFATTALQPEPFLRLHDSSGSVIGRDIGSALDKNIEQLSARLGAFPARPAGPLRLPDRNYGSALAPMLGKNLFTASVTSLLGEPGLSLLELYDASDDGRRGLRNLSIRARAGSGDKTLTAGFVLQGAGPARILIRAVGPTLAEFQINGTAPDPTVRLFNRYGEIAVNSDWKGDPSIVAAARAAGAFPLAADSLDAALVVNLVPGIYTAQVHVGDSGAGEVLLELYHLDP